MEYVFDLKERKWKNISHFGKEAYMNKKEISELKNKINNGDCFKTENRFPGIRALYIYEDIEDIKFIDKFKNIYISYSDAICQTRAHIPFSKIKNLPKNKPIVEDVVDFIDNFILYDCENRFKNITPIDIKMTIQSYLSEEQILLYTLNNGKFANLI